jgi:hypothetical protein
LVCKRGADESILDYIKHFTQHKNKLKNIPDSSIITAFTAGIKSDALSQDIGRRKDISLQDMFALAHEHADSEDCFNASNDIYML